MLKIYPPTRLTVIARAAILSVLLLRQQIYNFTIQATASSRPAVWYFIRIPIQFLWHKCKFSKNCLLCVVHFHNKSYCWNGRATLHNSNCRFRVGEGWGNYNALSVISENMTMKGSNFNHLDAVGPELGEITQNNGRNAVQVSRPLKVTVSPILVYQCKTRMRLFTFQ